LIHYSLNLPVTLATNLGMIWAIVAFRAWSLAMHHEYMLKISSCHLEGGELSMVNRCFKSVVDE